MPIAEAKLLCLWGRLGLQSTGLSRYSIGLTDRSGLGECDR